MENNLEVFKNDVENNLKNIKKHKLDILILERQNEELCKQNNREIEILKNKINDLEQEMKINLKGSGEQKIDTPAGWCAFRKMPDKWEYVDSDIIAWCKKDGKPYYKTIEVVKKFELKKHIQNGILKYEVPGIKVTPQDPKFHYKIKSDI